MESNPDTITLLSLGDASVDVFLTPTESESLCEIRDKKAIICFSYGNKIPVKSLSFSIGGNAANNEVGASRLGIGTAIVLNLGDDSVGSQITDDLKKEKINFDKNLKQPETNSNNS